MRKKKSIAKKHREETKGTIIVLPSVDCDLYGLYICSNGKISIKCDSDQKIYIGNVSGHIVMARHKNYVISLCYTAEKKAWLATKIEGQWEVL